MILMQDWLDNRHIWKAILAILALVALLGFCANTEAPTEQELVEEYIASITESVEPEIPAQYLCDAANEYGLDVWILVAMAQFESRFNVSSRGDAGERGLLQVHPCHKKKFQSYGCDWDDSFDVVRFGACMLYERLNDGQTLYKALSPWSVRKRALKVYKSMPYATQTGLKPPESSENSEVKET